MKLSSSQITALQFLSKEPWVAAWWGGKPYGRWPKELNAKTVQKLVSLKLIRIKHQGRFDRALTITEVGKLALHQTLMAKVSPAETSNRYSSTN